MSEFQVGDVVRLEGEVLAVDPIGHVRIRSKAERNYELLGRDLELVRRPLPPVGPGRVCGHCEHAIWASALSGACEKRGQAAAIRRDDTCALYEPRERAGGEV